MEKSTNKSGFCDIEHLIINHLLQGTFLMDQWLGLHASNAGAWVQSLVKELDPAYLN